MELDSCGTSGEVGPGVVESDSDGVAFTSVFVEFFVSVWLFAIVCVEDGAEEPVEAEVCEAFWIGFEVPVVDVEEMGRFFAEVEVLLKEAE